MSQKNCLKRLKNTRFFFVLITSVLSLLLTFLLSDAIYAQTSDRISLQGKIVRNDPGYEGLNVVNGTPACVQSGADTCDFQVRYYSASVSGTLYFTETFSDVEIGDYGGVFNLKLGSGSPTTTTQCADGTCNSVSEVFGEHKAIYMEIRFAPGGAGSFTEVFTRTPLNASAFAMGAGSNSFSFYKKDNAGEANLTATAGAVYYNTTNNKLKVYNGTTWESIGGESLWASENISSWTEGQFLGEGTEGLAQSLSTFSLDPDEGRATINTSARRGGLSVYSAYTGTDAWSLVSIKGEKSTFNGTLLNLTQDGTGDLIQGHYQSSPTPNFRVDRFGGLHLALDGIGYFEKFLSLPSSASLHPNSNEGCLYSVGSNLYWDPVCDASGPVALGAGSTSLWTDSGTYTYLTSVTDDLVLGASTTSGSSFFFDVSAKRLGIGTDTPQASIDIAGSNSTISNTSGNITITPNQNLLLASGKLGIGTASPTASLHIKAGATTAGTAPIKFTAGTNLTTAESGAMEWDGSRLYMTDTTPVRNTIAYTSDFSGSLLPSGTEGQMLYNNAGVWTGYSGMYWDDTYSQLGIGTTSPTATLSVQGSITGGENAFSTANNNFTFGHDSEPDSLFNVEFKGAGGEIYAIAVQSDGKILIGGDFTTYAGTTR
ncbi:MAG: delta-60 repeat domain-containing protein, partial [Candidatus Dojkabacteria bacterium]